MSAQGGDADGARVKEVEVGGAGAGKAGCWGAEGNPAKLKLCLTRGGLCKREEGGGCWVRLEEEEEEEEERENECFFSSSLLWTKWQRIPYGQKPIV